MDTKQCKTCGTTFTRGRWDVPSRWASRTICSAACRTAWNKGLTAQDERVAKYVDGGKATRFSSESTSGDKNVKWKGEKASYTAIHMWVTYHFGRPKVCESCQDNTRKMYHWANISGEYRRERSDWLRLCVPCHKAMDISVTK